MTTTQDSSNEPNSVQPAAPVRIPNVAGLQSDGLPKRTIAIAAAGVLAFSGAVGFGVWKFSQWRQAQDEATRPQRQDRLAADAMEHRRRVTLEKPAAPASAAASAPASAPAYVLDDLRPDAADKPVPMTNTGQRPAGGGTGYGGAQAKVDPRDASMLLSSRARPAPAVQQRMDGGGDEIAQARAQVQQMQAQTAAMLQEAQRRQAQQQRAPGLMPMAYTPGADAPPGVPVVPQRQQAQPQGNDEPVRARMLGDLSLTMPAGNGMRCHLAVKVITSTAGVIKCVLTQDVRGADGQIVLAEKGSVLTGNYQMVQIQPGIVSIPATWTRLRTPRGVVVNIDSPATGPLGEGGIPAHVNNRWVERIGASVLLSFLDGVVRIAVNSSEGDRNGNTVVLGGMAQGGNRIAEEVLNATIKIKPLLTALQGDEVGVLLQHDLSFADVYRLRPAALPR
jgi:type IV secretion system protein VirB10